MYNFKFHQFLSASTPICRAKVDVGFILDSSGSLRNEYHKEKDFLKAVANAFDISADGSRVGVVTFSFNAEHSIKLKDHSDKSSFNAAVDAIPLMGSTTRIDRALRLTQKELFAAENGGRKNVPKILVLMTDGSQTADADAEDPGKISEELRKAGIELIVLGIGKGVDKEELDHMAGGKGKAYSAASLDDLNNGDFVSKLTSQSCEAGR